MADLVILAYDAPGFMTTDVCFTPFPNMEALVADFEERVGVKWEQYCEWRKLAREFNECSIDLSRLTEEEQAVYDQLKEELRTIPPHPWAVNEQGYIYRDEYPDYREHDVINFVAVELDWGQDHMLVGQGDLG